MKIRCRQFDSGAVWRFRILSLASTICLAVIILISPVAQAGSEIKVGAIFDQTGGFNFYGFQQRKTLHLAMDNINKKEGLLGQQLRLIEYAATSLFAPLRGCRYPDKEWLR